MPASAAFGLMAFVTGFASAMVVLFVVLLFTQREILTVRRSTIDYVADCAGCASAPEQNRGQVASPDLMPGCQLCGAEAENAACLQGVASETKKARQERLAAGFNVYADEGFEFSS
jgi:hypothetical protein